MELSDLERILGMRTRRVSHISRLKALSQKVVLTKPTIVSPIICQYYLKKKRLEIIWARGLKSPHKLDNFSFLFLLKHVLGIQMDDIRVIINANVPSLDTFTLKKGKKEVSYFILESIRIRTSLTISKKEIFNLVLFTLDNGLGMKELSIPIPQLHPLFFELLKPQHLFLGKGFL